MELISGRLGRFRKVVLWRHWQRGVRFLFNVDIGQRLLDSLERLYAVWEGGGLVLGCQH